MPKYGSEIEAAIVSYADLAKQWFTLWFNNPEAFEERLRAGLQFGRKDSNAENRISLTRSLGLFSYEAFEAMMSGGESYKPALVAIVWDRMLDAGLLLKALPSSGPNQVPLATHKVDLASLARHINDGTFANLFASPARLPETYCHAVAAIDVTKDGDSFRGTGFAVEREGRQYLVTCKHNVDPEEGVIINEITTASGLPPSRGEFILSPNYDIAIAPLISTVAGKCFVLSEDVEIFDEVYTLGYPMVPRAEPLLLGHRGELNGHANLYVENCPALIISNLVSPGSSGSPVLTRDGHCVGMTINWLEGERQKVEHGDENEKQLERMRFSAALPAKLLIGAIEAISRAN